MRKLVLLFLGLSTPEGFGKAVSVCMGKPVCWSCDIGREFVESVLEKRRLHEEEVSRRNIEIQQHLEDVTQLVDDVISNVVHLCESLIIEEVSTEKVKTKNKYSVKKCSRSDVTYSNELLKKNDSKMNTRIKSSIKIKKKNEALDVSIDEQSITKFNKSVTNNQKKTANFSIMNDLNVSVEHETSITSLNHFITFDVIKNILSIAFWNVTVRHIEDKSIFEKAEDLFNEIRSNEFNSEVLAHEYLNNPKFLDLIKSTYKFLYKNPVEIVKTIIEDSD